MVQKHKVPLSCLLHKFECGKQGEWGQLELSAFQEPALGPTAVSLRVVCVGGALGVEMHAIHAPGRCVQKSVQASSGLHPPCWWLFPWMGAFPMKV